MSDLPVRIEVKGGPHDGLFVEPPPGPPYTVELPHPADPTVMVEYNLIQARLRDGSDQWWFEPPGTTGRFFGV